MSATGRKKHNSKGKAEERDPFDYYPTPNWCIKRFVEKASHRLPVGNWIEPAAGDGAIIRSITSYGKGYEKVQWTSVEIQDRFKESLEEVSDKVCIGNFASYLHPGSKADVCITNPPYKLAESMIKHAQTQAKSVVMLLRINFLASEKRRDWMEQDTPDIYVIPNRPSFRGKGSDATEYAWFVWDDKSCGRIFILDSTPRGVRQAEKKALRQKQTI